MTNANTGGNDAPTLSAPPELTLDVKLQNRNVLVYAVLTSLIFLSASTLYVGYVQASLCKRFNTSDTIANLPGSAYLAMAWFPVLIAWLFPQARVLKFSMSLAYGIIALACATVAGVLVIGAPSSVIVGLLVAHAAIVGAANGVVLTHGWEVLGRGVSESRRGKAFSLAFGIGAGFAVVGSLGAQLILDGAVLGWEAPPALKVAYPFSYALLFAVSATFMGIAALLVQWFTFPLPKVEVERQPFRTAVLGGFSATIRHPALRFACLGYLLVYAGLCVNVNMSIFTAQNLGVAAESLVGYQLALRFSFKIAAGALLGWVLIKTYPKIPLLITVGLLMACILWVLLIPGRWVLVAFGLSGAGELFGVYFVNYAVSCSPKSQIRRNLAFLFLISALVGVAPIFYGWISDHFGLRASFWAALLLLLFTTALMQVKLPKRPQPRPEDLTAADL